MSTDVIVVGSGAAGLTAALTAAKAGLSTVVLESTPLFGGTTALSGGGLWIPLNDHQAEIGVEDSRETAVTYFKSLLGDLYDAQKVDAYIDTGPRMLRWIEENTALTFSANYLPDYHPGKPGAISGRSLVPADFDGRKLGKDFHLVRPPIPEMGLFHSMQVSFADAYRLQHWNDSLANAVWALKRIGHYALERLLGRRGSRMANGNALVGGLFKACRDAGVTLINNARAHSLLTDSGAVTGIVFSRDGREERLLANRGVLLATGGFGANESMRRKYQPQAAQGWSLQPEGSVGEGIAMGQAVGGVLNESNIANGIWVPVSANRRADGTLALYPSLAFDRHCPGSIMIDAATGRRFVDESHNYQNFGQTAWVKGIDRIWMISDAEAVGKYGMGMVKPRPFSPAPWVRKGYIVQAPTIAALAAKIHVDAEALETTVANFNTYADTGKDLDFQRGDNAYSAYMGDYLHKPNPALGALRTPPFYALEIRVGSLSTLAGLETNAHAQVLDASGAPIPGLYAAGLDDNSFMRGIYFGGGASIGPAMTFGHIAARHMSGTADTDDETSHALYSSKAEREEHAHPRDLPVAAASSNQEHAP